MDHSHVPRPASRVPGFSMKDLIIAIDGPSGVGKSTLSKLLARELGYLNLDTGAMYRTVALAASRSGIDASDHADLQKLCKDVFIEFSRKGNEEFVMLNGEDVSRDIRTPEISLLTSVVAACPEVRKALVERQRELGEAGGVVLEGRDIGTVVFPRADVKFFLQATSEVRGQRRFLELQSQGAEVGLARTIADVKARDNADINRLNSPLKQADEAVLIDTTELDIPQVLEHMLAVILKTRKTGQAEPPG